MSYPSLPDNRLIVNDVDLTSRYGMILTDGYTMDPPTAKTYTVDIPGGDGKLDLTESLLGDTAYENRSMEFTFYLIDINKYETRMTEINRFLHGKAYDFKLTMDPDYTYHGRFSVSNMSQASYMNGLVGSFKVTVDADPYKFAADKVCVIDAIGGKTSTLESGRKRVRPTIETDCFIKVIYDHKLYSLPQGTWSINDILFQSGLNELYINSFDIKNLTWGDIKNNSITWAEFKKKRLYEWYKSNGDMTQVIETWTEEESKTWTDLSEKTWSDLRYMSEVTKDVKEIYVKYKVGDL